MPKLMDNRPNSELHHISITDKTKYDPRLKLTRARSSISLTFVSSDASNISSSSKVRSSSKSWTSMSADGSKSWSTETAEPPRKMTPKMKAILQNVTENMEEIMNKSNNAPSSILCLINIYVDYRYIQVEVGKIITIFFSGICNIFNEKMFEV